MRRTLKLVQQITAVLLLSSCFVVPELVYRHESTHPLIASDDVRRALQSGDYGDFVIAPDFTRFRPPLKGRPPGEMWLNIFSRQQVDVVLEKVTLVNFDNEQTRTLQLDRQQRVEGRYLDSDYYHLRVRLPDIPDKHFLEEPQFGLDIHYRLGAGESQVQHLLIQWKLRPGVRILVV